MRAGSVNEMKGQPAEPLEFLSAEIPPSRAFCCLFALGLSACLFIVFPPILLCRRFMLFSSISLLFPLVFLFVTVIIPTAAAWRGRRAIFLFTICRVLITQLCTRFCFCHPRVSAWHRVVAARRRAHKGGAESFCRQSILLHLFPASDTHKLSYLTTALYGYHYFQDFNVWPLLKSREITH